MNGCSIKPIKHLLWDELANHFGKKNRSIIKYWYRVATNRDFLALAQDELVMNEEGLPTMASLLRAANKTEVIEEMKLLVALEINADAELDYDNAVVKMTQFNRESPHADLFLATIVPLQNGKVKLKIVDNNETTKKVLMETIKSRCLSDRIKYVLNSHGVNAEFVDELNMDFNGVYSSKNPLKTKDGLLTLIKISLHSSDIDATLAEEAGHFAIAALGNSGIVSRLENLLTSDVREEIYGDEYHTKDLGKNPRRETAGYLVGKALMNNVDRNSMIGKLAHRISVLAKRLVASIKRDDILKAEIESEELARQIAENFMSDSFEGSIEKALERPERFFDKKKRAKSSTEKLFDLVIGNLKNLLKQVKSYDQDKTKQIGTIIDMMQSGKDWELMAKEGAAVGIALGMMALAESVRDMKNILADINIEMSDKNAFQVNFIKNAKNIRRCRDYVQACTMIISAYQGAVSGNSKLSDRVVQIIGANGSIVEVDLDRIKDELNTLLTGTDKEDIGLALMVHQAEKEFFTTFCEDILGRDYIVRAERALWGKGGIMPTCVSAKKYTIRHLIEYLPEDSTLFGRFFGSMSNCNDIICLIVFKAYKTAKKASNDNTLETWKRLKELNDKFNRLNLTYKDPRILCEKDENGVVTGNVISFYNQAKYDAEYEAMKKQAIKDFREMHEGDEELLNSEIRFGNEFSVYFKPIRKEFMKRTHTKINGKWELNDEYINKDYVENILGIKTKQDGWQGLARIEEMTSAHKSNLREVLEEWRAIKDELDLKLPKGSTYSYRLPQFRTDSIRRKNKNKGHSNGNILSLAWTGLGTVFRDNFTIDMSSGEYGSDMTYNHEDLQLIENEVSMFEETVNRVPLYGINRLERMSLLNTDIFGSLLAYADMCNNYEALNKVVDTFEIGKTVLYNQRRYKPERTLLKNKSIKGLFVRKSGALNNVSDSEDLGISIQDLIKAGRDNYTFVRYTKFMDRQVYGKSALGLFRKSHPLVFHGVKFLSWMTGLSAFMYLGGSLSVAALNIADGAYEVLREARVRQHYTKKEMVKATMWYFGMLIPNAFSHFASRFRWIPGLGNQRNDRNDILNALINKYNMDEGNTKRFKSWKTTGSLGIKATLDDLAYGMMRSGELYMNCVPYIAMMMHEKVVNLNGKEISLWDAYKYNGKLGLSTNGEIKLDGTFFKSKKDYATAMTLSWVKDELEEILEDTKDLTDSEYKAEILNRDLEYYLTSALRNGESVAKYFQSKGIQIRENTNDNEDDTNPLKSSRADLLSIINNIEISINNLQFGAEDEAQLMAKARLITNEMHGIYDEDNKGTFANNVALTAWASMKGYLFGMMSKRFTENRYNIFDEKKITDGFGNTKMITVEDQDGNKSEVEDIRGEALGYFITAFTSLALALCGRPSGSAADRAKEKVKNISELAGMLTLSALGNTVVGSGKLGDKIDRAVNTIGADLGIYKEAGYNVKRCVTDAMHWMIMLAAIGMLGGAIGGDDDDDDLESEWEYQKNNPWKYKVNLNCFNEKQYPGVRDFIKKQREDWEKGIENDKNMFLYILLIQEQSGKTLIDENTPEGKATMEALRHGCENWDKNINRSVESLQVDYRGMAIYILTRHLRDVTAFIDPRVIVQEVSSNTNLTLSCTAISGTVNLVKLVYTGVGGLKYQEINDLNLRYIDEVNNRLEYLKKNKIIAAKEAKEKIVTLYLINLYNKDKTIAKASLILGDDFVKEFEPYILYMVEHDFKDRKELETSYKDFYRMKNTSTSRKGDAIFKQQLQRVIPYWKSEKFIYLPNEALSSYFFAVKSKI